MKKLFLLVTIAVFAIGSMNAQGVNFGVKAGLNLPTFTGDDTDNLSTFTTYHVGAVANIAVSDNFSVQPGCLFSCQGAEYTMSEGYDGKFELGYINVPVMAQVQVANGLNVAAGPQVGFLLSAEDVYESIDTPGDSGEDDISEEVKGIDFGVNLGANYQFPSGLNIGASYNIGLSNVVDSSDFDGTWRNNTLQFSVGWMFGLAGGNDD